MAPGRSPSRRTTLLVIAVALAAALAVQLAGHRRVPPPAVHLVRQNVWRGGTSQGEWIVVLLHRGRVLGIETHVDERCNDGGPLRELWSPSAGPGVHVGQAGHAVTLRDERPGPAPRIDGRLSGRLRRRDLTGTVELVERWPDGLVCRSVPVGFRAVRPR